mgnify:CR=1 FL=1
MQRKQNMIKEIWEYLKWQPSDVDGGFSLGAKWVMGGLAGGGLVLGISALLNTCYATSYARRDQIIQQMYQQADTNRNNMLDKQERNDLLRKLDEYTAKENVSWSLDDLRKYLSVLPDVSLEKALEEIKQGERSK